MSFFQRDFYLNTPLSRHVISQLTISQSITQLVGRSVNSIPFNSIRFSSVYSNSIVMIIKLALTCSGFCWCLTALSTQKGKREQVMVKERLQKIGWTIIWGRKDFDCKKAAECGTEPYHLLSLTIAWEDLVGSSTKKSLSQPIYQPVINLPINRSISQSIGQSVNQSRVYSTTHSPLGISSIFAFNPHSLYLLIVEAKTNSKRMDFFLTQRP